MIRTTFRFIGGCILVVGWLIALALFIGGAINAAIKPKINTLYVPSGEVPASRSVPWDSGGSGVGYDDLDGLQDPPECSVHPERCIDFNEPDIEPPVEYGGRATGVTSNCSPAYPDVCIPPAPPDLNCKDIPYKRFRVLQPDPHKFDGNKNGIGCE